jgi:hypothetical protein
MTASVVKTTGTEYSSEACFDLSDPVAGTAAEAEGTCADRFAR